MEIFSREKNCNMGTELLWIFLVIVSGIELGRQELYSVKNLGELLEIIPVAEGLQLFGMLLLIAAGILIAFLQELTYKGKQWLKAGAPAGCMTGLFLLALYHLKGTLFEVPPDQLLLWNGRLALPAGYLLTVLPSVLKYPKNQDFSTFYKLSKVIILPIILTCAIPRMSLYGMVLPLGLCLIYETTYLYRKEKEKAETDLLNSLCQTQRENAGPDMDIFSDSSEDGGFREELLKKIKKTEGMDSGEKPVEKPVENIAEFSAQDTKEIREDSKEHENIPDQQITKTKARKTNLENLFSAIPEGLGKLYLYDRGKRQIYRYDKKNQKLMLLGTESYPGFDVLVSEKDRTAFRKFLEEQGNRQISALLWDENNACFQETVIHAAADENTPGLELLLCVDSSTSGRRYERKLEETQKTERELEKQLELARDEQRRVFQSTRELLNDIIQKKSNESKMHLNHVSQYSEILLKTYGRRHPEVHLDTETIEKISEAALFHDIGKIEVPDQILNKHERLTPEEQEEMQKHTVYGAKLINKMPFVDGYEDIMKYALELALHHHERYDGTGYPEGQKGEQIPWFVQLVSLADAYEALTSDRSYRKGRSHTEASQMILNGECGAFSEEMMRTFTEAMPALQDIHYQFETVI